MKKLKILAFGAHPDDIEVSMLGTLLKYKEQGHEVKTVIVTDGQRGGVDKGKELAQIRKNEALEAAQIIGVKPIFLNFEDGRLEYNIKTYEKFLEIYQDISPDLIITHSPEDYHPDHRKVSKLVTDVAKVPVLFSETLAGVNFIPDYYVDITEQFNKKIKARSCHTSQYVDKGIERIKIVNRFRGMQCNSEKIKYAEVFKLFKKYGNVKAYELLPE
jgi:LmbE family N-acetylglucosaminyl deacetylase